MADGESLGSGSEWKENSRVMRIEMTCEHCGTQMQLPMAFDGQVIKCVQCWEEIAVVREQMRETVRGGMSMGVAWMQRVDGGDRPVLLLEGQPESVHDWVEREEALAKQVTVLKEEREAGCGETGMWDVRELAAGDMNAGHEDGGGDGVMMGGNDQAMMGVQFADGEDGQGVSGMNDGGSGGDEWIADVGELSEQEMAAQKLGEGANTQEAVVARMKLREDEQRRGRKGITEYLQKEAEKAERKRAVQNAGRELNYAELFGGLAIAIVGGLAWAFAAMSSGYVLGFGVILVGLATGLGLKLIGKRAHRDLGVLAVLLVVVGFAVGKGGVMMWGLEEMVAQDAYEAIDPVVLEGAVAIEMLDGGELTAMEGGFLGDGDWGQPLESYLPSGLYEKIRGGRNRLMRWGSGR